MNEIIVEDIREICNETLDWKKFFKKRILITGARGYIATYLIYSLLKLNETYDLGVRILALCRGKQQSERYYSEFMQRSDFELIIQDVCEKINVRPAADIVIHAASIANIYAQYKNPYDTIKANIIGLNNILDYCEQYNCEQLLFFSSFLVYGNINKKVNENVAQTGYLDFRDYKNGYALSKQMGELMLQCKKRSGLKTRINVVRPLNVYGPGEHYYERKPMTDFLGNFLRAENIVLKSDGQQIRSYLYLSDAIKGIYYILLCGEDEECYNLASEKNVYKIKDMAEMFAINNSNIGVVTFQKEESYFKKDNSVLLASTDKLKALGWQESVMLEDGIKRMIDWAQDSDFFTAKTE